MVNSSQEIFLAQPVVTPIEQLRRKDKEVARALEDKQKLIEEILNIPHEELESITENSNNSVETRGAGHRSAAEILLSALSQAKTLTSLVNKTLKLSEEEAMQAMSLRTQEEKLSSSLISEQQRIVAKGERLIEITMAINKQLTMLLTIIQENEKERESLRRELARSQDQVSIIDIIDEFSIVRCFRCAACCQEILRAGAQCPHPCHQSLQHQYLRYPHLSPPSPALLHCHWQTLESVETVFTALRHPLSQDEKHL